MPPISDHLNTIKAATKSINSVADLATQQIRSLEKFLAENNPGIEVWCESSLKNEQGKNRKNHIVDVFYILGFARDDDSKWGLVLKHEAVATDDNGDTLYETFPNPMYSQPMYSLQIHSVVQPQPPQSPEIKHKIYQTLWIRPLSSCPREIRIASLPYIEKLLADIAKKAKELAIAASGNSLNIAKVVNELQSALSTDEDIAPTKPPPQLPPLPPPRNIARRK